MKKKSYAVCLFSVIFFASLLCGCERGSDIVDVVTSIRARTRPELAVQETELMETSREQKGEDREQEMQVSDTRSSRSIEAMEDAYQVIMENCTSEFIGFYPLDESFFVWLNGEYGEECILRLAEEVCREKPDANVWYEETGSSIHALWPVYCSQTGFSWDHQAHGPVSRRDL